MRQCPREQGCPAPNGMSSLVYLADIPGVTDRQSPCWEAPWSYEYGQTSVPRDITTQSNFLFLDFSILGLRSQKAGEARRRVLAIMTQVTVRELSSTMCGLGGSLGKCSVKSSLCDPPGSLSDGASRQESWSVLLFAAAGDLPNPDGGHVPCRCPSIMVVPSKNV